MKIKSLDKALKLLDYIPICEEGASISELNKIFRFGKSTIHRLLGTLKINGYIHQNESSRYIIGYKIYELSHRFQKNYFLTKIGRKYLDEITRFTQETSNLAILESRDVLYLAKVESFQQLRATAPVGGRLPAHCTALGKMLLAGFKNNYIQTLYSSCNCLPKLTPHSISNVNTLLKEIEKIRIANISHDNEESSIGVYCIAAPIRDFSGNIIAAVSISFPTQRAGPRLLPKISKFLMHTANEFSKELGYKKIKNNIPE